MGISRRQPRPPAMAGIAAALLLSLSAAHAGPGFISGSHVDKGNVYAELTVRFRCKIQYLGHDPAGRSDMIRIRLEATTVCAGTTPAVADSRELHRPLSADDAQLDSIEYDGESGSDRVLRLNFNDEVSVRVRPGADGESINVQVFAAASGEQAPRSEGVSTARLIRRAAEPATRYVINLESSQRQPTTADLPQLRLAENRQLFVTESAIGGQTWYRVRVGYFETAEEAARALRTLRGQFPGAWIDRAAAEPAAAGDTGTFSAVDTSPAAGGAQPVDRSGPRSADSSAAAADASVNEVAALMLDARRAMTAGEQSRAVQIYTKVLRLPANEHQPEAQEFLALARERSGQVAHAKAEYRRYLDLYPDADGANRVRQRLAALLSTASPRARQPAIDGQTAAAPRRSPPSNWKFRTYLSQYYRRDVNQVNDQDEVVSQSSIYTDASLDARHRGERFDFSSRLTAGYRNDLLSGSQGGGNDFRLSYAYADLADSRTRLRGRLGRQTRTGGGVLGRFDGLNLSYALTERLRFDAVGGTPVFSTSDSIDDLRSFYGLSANFGPVGDNFDLGVFFLQQDIDGLTDRQAVGAEVRYFGEKRTFWGMLDYDTAFKEIGSGFLQASWRLPASFTVTGLVDRRRSPYLSLGNALIGQLDQDFTSLRLGLSEDDLRQLALDRSASTTTLTLGLSKPLTPKLQLGFNATRSNVDATIASADVAATPESEYSYYSVDLVASSLFTEGDVGIVSLRHSQSSTTDINSLSLDSRFPIGRAWRISPRLRIDYRQIRSDMSEEWIYTPGLRLQYRPTRKLRVQLEAGRQYSSREMTTLDLEPADMDRESYFVNFGYQLFF